MKNSEFIAAVNSALDMAHNLSLDSIYYNDWFIDVDICSNNKYHYFEMGMTISSKGGVEHRAIIYDYEDCSGCPQPIFACGRGESKREAMNNLMADMGTS